MPEKLFITISPQARTIKYSNLKFVNPNYCVYIDDLSIITNAFKKNKIKTYVIYPEFDEKGRLHYHGRITVSPTQKVSLYRSVKPILERNIGFTDIVPVKHDLENLIYCMKTFAYTQAMLDITKPISTDILNAPKIPMKKLNLDTLVTNPFDYYFL